ncbi:MAG: helix-turn-helix domain-containing protein [Candidatus Aminicenantes bacterium]|nr:helix-turn-helix domain-containing protein [Candidatus Aminicenantes bacterium]
MEWNGKLLKSLANNRKISLQVIADHIGVSRQTVNDWIRGQIPKGNHLLMLCSLLDVDPDDFFRPNVEKHITLPLHRVRGAAKVTDTVEDQAMTLAKDYLNLFRNHKNTNVLPVIRSADSEPSDARTIAELLRAGPGIKSDFPLDMDSTFRLADYLGIYLIFKTFPPGIKSYAFYTNIEKHRVIFINKSTNVLDLIFPLLHEYIHAVRDDVVVGEYYEKEEERFCDLVANYVQFPEAYVELVYTAVQNLEPGSQVNMLKSFAARYRHSLVGIVEAIKLLDPAFDLDVYAANTNLKKEFSAVGDMFLNENDPAVYVNSLYHLNPGFLIVVKEQLDNLSDRRLAELLELPHVLDAKEVRQKISNFSVSH